MAKRHEYAEGTPEMIKRDAERAANSRRRNDKIRGVIYGNGIDVVIMAVILCGVLMGSYLYQKNRYQKQFAERDAVRLAIEEECFDRGGELITSRVNDDRAYCLSDDVVHFKVDNLFGPVEETREALRAIKDAK